MQHLGKTFVDKGAKVVLGWTETTCISPRSGVELLSNMLSFDNNLSQGIDYLKQLSTDFFQIGTNYTNFTIDNHKADGIGEEHTPSYLVCYPSLSTVGDYKLPTTGGGDPEPKEPKLEVTPTTLNFPNTIIGVGNATKKTLIIKNTGGAPLKISVESSLNTTFIPDAWWINETIPANSQKQLVITFLPTEAKVYNGTITITNNNDNNNKIEVKCSGIGINDPNEEVELNAGLVAYFPFNRNADDKSGLGNHGINYGVTWGQDRRKGISSGSGDGCAVFDGNARIEILNSPTLNFSETKSFTISLWYNINELPEKGKDVFFVTRGFNFYFWLSEKSHVYAISEPHWGTVQSSTQQPPILNKYTHIVYVISETKSDIYLNGVWVANGNSGGPYSFGSSNNINLGNGSVVYYTWTNFKGQLDDVRIYNRALNKSEVEALYKE